MKSARLAYKSEFKVLTGNTRSQVAEMVLPSGGSSGTMDNSHKGSDQWLYVESGEGEAIIQGRSVPLTAGKIVLIERGEGHQVRNTSHQPLKTLNIYVPPAYTKAGGELPAGRSK